MGARTGSVNRAAVAAWAADLVRLASDRSGPRSARDVVDLLADLEGLVGAARAAQARLSVELDAAEHARHRSLGIPAERAGAGVGAQVGLARRVSPHRGAVLLGAAKVLCAEMPHAFDALALGHLSERRAIALVAETACLTREHRAEVDRLVCAPGPDGRRAAEGLGDRAVSALARSHAARLDPGSLVARAARATADRTVTLRPAPDTMTYLTALLPVAQGVAAYAALTVTASAATARGDVRARGQVMADTLVERLTGQATAEAIPVTVDLVVSDATLLAADSAPGHLIGGGPVPGPVARTLVAHALDADAAWVRQLYTAPGGRLVAMTSKQRFHPSGLADLLRLRDLGTCRTPWCDAPVRHHDHVVPAGARGPTDAENGQGLCEACNHAKQAPGWSHEQVADPDRHTVAITTPTGHRHHSRAPDLPDPLRAPAHPAAASVIDLVLAELQGTYAVPSPPARRGAVRAATRPRRHRRRRRPRPPRSPVSRPRGPRPG